jgi:hypothetical protein
MICCCRRYTKHMYVLPLVIIFKTIYVRNLPKRLLWMGNIYHDPQVMMAGGIKKQGNRRASRCFSSAGSDAVHVKSQGNMVGNAN